MVFLGATLFATLCGWVLDSMLSSFASFGVRLMVGLVVTTVAFYWARGFLKDLRGR